jgi:hypothetical protein
MTQFYNSRLNSWASKMAKEDGGDKEILRNSFRLIARQIAVEFGEGNWRKDERNPMSGKVVFKSYTMALLVAVIVDFLGNQTGYNFTDYKKKQFVETMGELLEIDDEMLEIIYSNYQKYVWDNVEGDVQ